MSAYTELVAERYEANQWWTRKPPPPPEFDDNDLAIQRRRRDLLAAADSFRAEDINLKEAT